MRTDGTFTTKLLRLKSWRAGKTVKIIPFGDIHHDSPAHCADSFQQFLDYAKKQKDAIFLGMGDYFDGYSTSERAIIYNGALHESSRRREELAAKGRVGKLAKQLEFMRGKLIGLLGGNHFSQFPDGTTSDQILAGMLGTSYLGACCGIRLSFCMSGQASGATVDIFAHHGRGGGVTAGGRLNAVEKMTNICDADIYLMGDNHARGVLNGGDRLYLRRCQGRLTVGAKTRWLGRTGSFLRAYMPGEESYVVDACLQPASLGWIWFDIVMVRDRSDGRDTVSLQIRGTQ